MKGSYYVPYVRPEKTHQEMLTSNDIKNKLKEYKQIDIKNIKDVPLGTHMRYFSIDQKTKQKKFRLGGMLQRIDDQYRFITLTNGTTNWSVQLNNSILYQKMTDNELKEELKKEIKEDIEKQHDSIEVQKLKDYITTLKSENTSLRGKIQDIKSEVNKRKK